eukprot:762744-Hanusia_phi.AAC.1
MRQTVPHITPAPQCWSLAGPRQEQDNLTDESSSTLFVLPTQSMSFPVYSCPLNSFLLGICLFEAGNFDKPLCEELNVYAAGCGRATRGIWFFRVVRPLAVEAASGS